MTAQTVIKADLGRLTDIINQLGGAFYTRVGIIGALAAAKHPVAETKISKSGKKNRVASGESSEMTNAEIGVLQEFGNAKIPPRSFLRMPIEEKVRDLIRFLGSKMIVDLIGRGEIKKVYTMLGIEAEGIVQDAFRSRGFGQWAPNSPVTIEKKGSDAPLIDIGELRKSVTSDVVAR